MRRVSQSYHYKWFCFVYFVCFVCFVCFCFVCLFSLFCFVHKDRTSLKLGPSFLCFALCFCPRSLSHCVLRAFQLLCFLFSAFQHFDAAEERHVSLADAVALLLPIRAGHDPEPWRTSVLKLLRRTRCPLRLLFLPRRFLPLIPRFLNKLLPIDKYLRFV